MNIVFIAVDDLKPLLNSYEHNEMITPNFDRLAKMGVQFNKAYVQQALCGPSRASVMTGTYPDHNKVWDLHTDFRNSAPQLLSMPEYLIQQGYTTAVCGHKIFHDGSCSSGHDAKSWSIPYQLSYNFDKKYNQPAARLYHNDSLQKLALIYKKEALDQGITEIEKIDKYIFDKIKISTEAADVTDLGYEDGVYAEQAITQIKQLNKNKKPFFLAVGFSRPHLPFNAPKKYWDLYKREEIKVAEYQKKATNSTKFSYHSFGELRSYNDISDDLDVEKLVPIEKQKELIHGYMACVSYVDAQLGKILDELEKQKIIDNTVIVLWGDHGYHLGDHSIWNKHSNLEQATHIPLFIAGPKIPKNKKINSNVELLDVFPTLFDIVQIEPHKQLDGKSLVPLFKNEDKSLTAISQYPRGKQIMGYSLRTTKYRYTVWFGKEYNASKPYDEKNIVASELYDLVNDYNETLNIFSLAENKQIISELHQLLLERLNQINKSSNTN